MCDSDSPKPKLRWYQFTLRKLLVFVAILSIPLSWHRSDIGDDEIACLKDLPKLKEVGLMNTQVTRAGFPLGLVSVGEDASYEPKGHWRNASGTRIHPAMLTLP